MDPFVWPEPAPLPDPTLVDFFTSPLPDSPPSLPISPDTPSNSTHPWESELAALQQTNAALQHKLSDLPDLLRFLDRQKSDLSAARRRLAAVEADNIRLRDTLLPGEPVAKRPRVDPPCCACASKPRSIPAIPDFLHSFALADVADFAPEVRTFVAVLEHACRAQKPQDVAALVYTCILQAHHDRSIRILRRIAAATTLEHVVVPALIERLIFILKKALQQTELDPLSTNDVVRVLLQGAAAGAWTKRMAGETIAHFVTSHREARDLVTLVLTSNEKIARVVLIEDTDGRNLNTMWGQSLHAVINFFTATPAPEPEAVSSTTTHSDAVLSRWNDIRTVVEDLQDHASLADAQLAFLLEWTMASVDTCFDIIVGKALFEQIGRMAKQTEKVENMVALIRSLITVLKRENVEATQRCVDKTSVWLVLLACAEDVEARIAMGVINILVEMRGGGEKEVAEHAELKQALARLGRRKFDKKDLEMLSPKAVDFLQAGKVVDAQNDKS